jgi:hypothetical protein
VDLPGILDEVMALEREVTDLPPGDRRLGEITERIDALEVDLDAQRGMAQPLVPGAERAPSLKEATAEQLELALRALREAVGSKRGTPEPAA